MQRLDIFRSGLPPMVAGIGLIVFAYLAGVRRDRLARYWAVAWGLLLARYVCNAFIDDVAGWPDYLKAVLRTAFAGTLFAGVWSLRRPPLDWRWITAAIVLPVIGQLATALTGARDAGTLTTLGIQAAFLVSAAVLLARTTSLPQSERCGTALALIAYVAASTMAPLLPSGSTALVTTVAASSVALLLIVFGLFAIYFRQAYESELQVITATSTHLAHALGEFVSVCMHCRAVQDEQRQWQPLETFVSRRRETQLSHGLCDACAEKHYGDLQPS